MTRRLLLVLFVALFAATPLAAQTDQQPPEGTNPEMGERMDRAEEGTMSGTVVLLDDENLIIETAEGDRAFSIDTDSELPAELRDADDWSTFNGSEVEVAFVPGEDGELRVVRTLTLVSPTGATTTRTTADTDLDADTAVEPMPDTDLADQSQLVEPDEVDASADLDVDVDTDGDTDAELTASANLQDDDDLDATTSGLVDDEDDDMDGEQMASLPATASSLPWLGLIGSVALLAALGLGWIESRRRRVTVGR